MNRRFFKYPSMLLQAKTYLSLVKFSHTIFAMPFAMIGLSLGFYDEKSKVTWLLVLAVVICMIFTRNAAMAFNRFVDKKIDAKNPRTSSREIPAGKVKSKGALLFVVVNSLLFVFTTYFINKLCFLLSPVALLVVLGYSYTKRFTSLSHLILGLGLSLAPVGAYLAIGGHFSIVPILIGLVVLFG